MPLNASGTMSVGGPTEGQSINLELFRAATANSNLNESALRSLAGVPSGTISLSNFYGKSNIIPRGYFVGGSGSSSQIDGIQFSNDTQINPTAALSIARYSAGGTNAVSKGFVSGGFSTAVTADIEGFAFSSETVSNPTANLAVARQFVGGMSSATVGYSYGGYTPAYTGEIDGINFSTESAVNPSAVATDAYQIVHSGQSTTTGYAYEYSGSAIYGLTFSTETNLGTVNYNSEVHDGGIGCQSRTAMYMCFGIGYTSDNTYYQEKFTFSNHTRSTVDLYPSWAGSQGGGVDSDTKGYCPSLGGGSSTTFTFSNETYGSVSAGLTESRYWHTTIQSGWN